MQRLALGLRIATQTRAGRATVRDLARHEDRRQALALDAPGAALAETVRSMLGGDA